MNDVYNPGQLIKVARMLAPAKPGWLVLGGPSNANEAQTAVSTWPGVRVIGVEPSKAHVAWQLAHEWPCRSPLLAGALTDREGPVDFYKLPGTSGGTLLAGYTDRPPDPVPGYTIDWLDDVYGPFKDVLLWLDVEGSEVAALRGAKALLASGRVLAVSVEVCDRTPAATEEVAAILTAAGLRGPKQWAASPPAYRDDLWVRG